MAALAVLIVAFVAVAAIGSVLQNNGVDSGTNAPSGDDDSGVPKGATSDRIDVIVLSGSGDAVTERFELKSSVAIFHMTYEGDSNFIVWLLTSAGERVDLLSNEIGSYSGSTLIGVSGSVIGASEGEHYLEIKSSGPWEVLVEQPIVSSATPVPLTLTGRGDDVPEPFQISDGPVRFDISHQGSSNFIVSLYDSEGHYIDMLANEIGSYSGSATVSTGGGIFATTPGVHYLDVKADGDWSIEISKM